MNPWLLAIRPATLPAAVAPVAVGTACAYAVSGLSIGPAVAALSGALLLQVGANLVNDVADFEKGADDAGRLGPTRVVAAGILSPSAVRVGAAVSFAGALLVGVYLTVVAGPAILVLGVASIAAAIAYTAGPYPLGYHGLGDVFVFVFFGLAAVCGTAFVQAGHIPELAWWAAVPVGALVTAILVVNNLRDRETDRQAGKHTLAVRLGERATVAQYATLVLAAYAAPVVIVALGLRGAWALLPLVSIPLAVRLTRAIATTRGRELNPLLGQTARLAVVHAALLAAGIALG